MSDSTFFPERKVTTVPSSLPANEKAFVKGPSDTYATLYIADISGVVWPVGASGGVTDHGALTGLADDDHTQYANSSRFATWLAAAVGVSVQAYNAGLAAISALTTTTFGRSLLELADAAAGRTALSAEQVGLIYGENVQTGTSYTLVLADAGKRVRTNNASSNTVTVPPNSSVAFATGTRIELFQYGAGQTTIAAGSGVTIRSSGSKLKLTGQYSGAMLDKIATDEWLLVGDIAA